MLNNKKAFIIFIGPPASGKGTQSDMLSEKTGLPMISTGNLCREEIKRKTKLGKAIKEKVIGGGLASPKDINLILDKRFFKKDLNKGFILDGYPRDFEQLQYLRDKFNDFSKEKGVFLVFYISVPDKETKSRLSGRRVCSSCGQTYHLKHNKPKKRGACDECGEKLIQRKDDNLKVVAKRLEFFHKENQPILDFFKKKNILIKINGVKKISKIHEYIVESFKKKIK